MNPYPGLRPFEEGEQDKFFGRDQECAVLIDKMLAHRLTLLFAASGVGKTSLLRAAVVPRLCDPEAEHLDAVVYRDWVEEPIAGLRQAIVDTLRASGRLQEGVFDQGEAPESLVELCELCTLFVRPPLVLILDQFEEFFRYQRDAATYETFLEQLGTLLGERSLPVRVVISMREDYALELDELRPFVRGVPFENYFRLERLSVDQAEEAIVAPAEQAGYRYEPDLIEALLEDLADRGDEQSLEAKLGKTRLTINPPYLQIACSELWRLEQGQERQVLRLKSYEAQGRAAGLLKVYVERVLEGLGVAEKARASRAFDHLITRRGTKMAYTVADLADVIGSERRILGETLANLSRARILIEKSRRGVLWYELHHDLFSPIIEHWNREYKEGVYRRKLQFAGWLASLTIMFVAYFIVKNLTEYHLRVDSRQGISEMVELYRGTPKGWDPLGARGYFVETDVRPSDLKSLANLEQNPVKRLSAVEDDLASNLPPKLQVESLWRAGRARAALDLAERLMLSPASEQIVEGLFELGSLEVVELLCQSLHGADGRQVQLIGVLKRTGLKQAAECLQEEFERSEVWLKNEIVRALGAVGTENAVNYLVKLLTDPEWSVRLNAVSALGFLDDAGVIEPLVGMLADPVGGVRSKTASVLGSLGRMEAIGPLTESLRDSDNRVRSSAANALGSIGGTDQVIPLIEALGDPEWLVRSNIASALAALGSTQAVEPLIQKLDDPQRRVRRSVLLALGVLADQRARVPVRRIFQNLDDSSDLRLVAAGVLLALEDDRGLHVLKSAAHSHQVLARREVAEILGHVRAEMGIPMLERLREDSYGSVREAATKALGQFADSQSLTRPRPSIPLLERLADPERAVRREALLALGSIADPRAFEWAVHAYQEEQLLEMRLAAAVTLLAFGDRRGFRDLENAIYSEQPWERRWVAEFLGAARAQLGVSLLEQLLTEVPPAPTDHQEIREAAIKALGKLASPRSVAALRRLAIEDNLTEARSAVGALSQIETRESIVAILDGFRANGEDLGFGFFELFANLGVTEALPELRRSLERLESQQRKWRLLRDSNTAEADPAWLRSVAANRLDSSEWGWQVAHAIAFLGPETSFDLLAHDLASVREGAAAGLALVGGVPLIQRLSEKLNTDQTYPFRVAAFQTIDRTLRILEATGGPDERQALLELLPSLKDRFAVCTRVEWTIQKLDLETLIELGQCPLPN